MDWLIAGIFIIGLIASVFIKGGAQLEKNDPGGCGGCLMFIGGFILLALLMSAFQ